MISSHSIKTSLQITLFSSTTMIYKNVQQMNDWLSTTSVDYRLPFPPQIVQMDQKHWYVTHWRSNMSDDWQKLVMAPTDYPTHVTALGLTSPGKGMATGMVPACFWPSSLMHNRNEFRFGHESEYDVIRIPSHLCCRLKSGSPICKKESTLKVPGTNFVVSLPEHPMAPAMDSHG